MSTQDETLDEIEQRCHEVISQLRTEFEHAARPYFEELARIAALRRPVLIIPLDQAVAAGLIPVQPTDGG